MEGLAAEELHHQVEPAARRAAPRERGDDVRVVQRPEHLDLVPEALLLMGTRSARDLHRDRAPVREQEIVGEVETSAEPEIVRRDDGSYLLDGLLPIDEFGELFAVEDIPGRRRIHGFHFESGDQFLAIPA